MDYIIRKPPTCKLKAYFKCKERVRHLLGSYSHYYFDVHCNLLIKESVWVLLWFHELISWVDKTFLTMFSWALSISDTHSLLLISLIFTIIILMRSNSIHYLQSSVIMQHVWSKLPENRRSAPTLSSFKSRLCVCLLPFVEVFFLTLNCSVTFIVLSSLNLFYFSLFFFLNLFHCFICWRLPICAF